LEILRYLCTKREKIFSERRGILVQKIIKVLLIFVVLALILPGQVRAEDYELYIARGIQNIHEGKIQDALVFLKKALELAPDNPEATFYAGLAYSRLGKYKEAEDLLIKAIRMDETDETATEAYLELGRIYYLTGRCDRSDEALLLFNSRTEDRAMKGLSQDIMAQCVKEIKRKPVRLHVMVGGQYDTNVIIEPDDPVLVSGDKEDYRALAFVRAQVSPLRRRHVRLNLDYNFYQSIHADLGDFNMQYHKVTPRIEINIANVVKQSLGYAFEYTLIDGDKFSRLNTLYAVATVDEGRKLATDIVYEYRSRKFWDVDISPVNSERSGHQHSVGAKQHFYFDKVMADVFFHGDFSRSDEEYWSYNGYRTGASVVIKVINPVNLILSGQYSERRYREEFPGGPFIIKRRDRMQEYSVGIKYKVSRRFSVFLNNTYIVNDSNLSGFEYTRNISSLFLRVGIL
jgi:tetratricopeptide (TPR) repeat protein